MDLKAYFDKGISAQQYESGFSADQRSLHQKHYDRADVEEFKIRLADSSKPLRIMVLTEPWCGDSSAIVPVLLKLLEGMEQVEVRFLARDRHPDLMDRYLTRGGRAIPKIIVADEEFNELFNWGPRPDGIQQIYEDHRSQIERGEVEKTDVIKKIRAYYAKDRGRAIAEDFTRRLLGVL